ncbi:hypothetical protein [Amycolatopsis sp. NPDC059021]|uniref:hypothetical protein n=1 Tax=Amycolatopsis sp. NPDC059021 TaxID=3346704 RepID=UPI0036727EC5
MNTTGPSGLGDENDMATITTPWGSYRVPKGGFLASAVDLDNVEQDRREQIDRGIMKWSISRFADLLWMVVPEARQGIFEEMASDITRAISHDSFLLPISDTALADMLYREHLLPGLRDLPAQQDLVIRCLYVLRRVMTEEPGASSIGGTYWDIFNVEIMHPLDVNGFGKVIDKLDPELGKYRHQVMSERTRM